MNHKICITQRWVSGFRPDGLKMADKWEICKDEIRQLSQKEFLEKRIDFFKKNVISSYANQTNKNFVVAIQGSAYGLNQYKSQLNIVKEAFESIGIEAFYCDADTTLNVKGSSVTDYLYPKHDDASDLKIEALIDNDDILPKNYIDEIIRDSEFIINKYYFNEYDIPIPIVLTTMWKRQLRFSEGVIYLMVKENEELLKNIYRKNVEILPPHKIPQTDFAIIYPKVFYNKIVGSSHIDLFKKTMPYFTNLVSPILSLHEAGASKRDRREYPITDKKIYDFFSLPYPENLLQ